MTREEIRLQAAISVIQGVLEAKHGVIGEVVPSLAVAESLRIADEFVKQWFGDAEVQKVERDDLEMISALNNCLDELGEKHGWNYVYVQNINIPLSKIRNWLKSFLRE